MEIDRLVYPKKMKAIIKTDNAPAPIGPYNQAVVTSGLIFVSGQIALNPITGELVLDTIEAETTQVMENIKAILTESGSGFDAVVKTTIFLKDMQSFNTVNEIYGSYFTADFPARETIQVAGLPKNVNVEISVIAAKG
jgi:2-iminobutanoate/2-iminopropanoate deaminase